MSTESRRAAAKVARAKRSAKAAAKRASLSKSSSSSSMGSKSSSSVVGGGPSDALKQLSIQMANEQVITGDVKEDLFDDSGERTGSTRSATGRIYATDGSGSSVAVTAAAKAAEGVAAESETASAIAKTDPDGISGGGTVIKPAGPNPYNLATTTFTKPTFDAGRYSENADYFSKMFDPGATAHSTAMYGDGATAAKLGLGGFAGGGAGGGGGMTWGDGSGQYTPGISADGQALTATRNLGVSGPEPTSKPQANAAGVPDTGGQSAVAKTNTGPDNSGLMASLEKLKAALSSLDLSSIMGTSDPVENAVANVDDALSNAYESALADLPDYAQQKADAKELFDLKADIIDDRRDALEERYKEDKEAIGDDFDQQREDKQSAQAIEKGQLSGGLAASGAYLGFDNINHSAMLSLNVTHSREMTVLGQAKMAALSEARRAFEDSDFALLTEHVNAIEAYDNKITELTNTHFTQTLQLTQEARNNVKFMQDSEIFERTKGFENLDTIIEAGTIPTDNDIRQYAQTFGLAEEDVRGFITAKKNSIELEKNRQKTSDDIALNNLLRGIDKGTFVNINGKTYEGLNTPTYSGSGSGGTGANATLTYKDVFEKYGNSDIAKMFIGQPVENLYEYAGQTEVPDDMKDFLADAIPDLSADPDDANNQIEETWDTMRRQALGWDTRKDIGDMYGSTLTDAINEVNQQLIDKSPDGAKVDLITQEDVNNNPWDYSPAYLRLMAAQWATRTTQNEAQAKDTDDVYKKLGLDPATQVTGPINATR